MTLKNKWYKYVLSIALFILINLLGNLLVGDVSFLVSVFSFAIVRFADLQGDSLVFSKKNFKGITLPVLILFFIGIFVALFWKNSLHKFIFNFYIVICFGATISVLEKNFWNWFDNLK